MISLDTITRFNGTGRVLLSPTVYSTLIAPANTNG